MTKHLYPFVMGLAVLSVVFAVLAFCTGCGNEEAVINEVNETGISVQADEEEISEDSNVKKVSKADISDEDEEKAEEETKETSESSASLAKAETTKSTDSTTTKKTATSSNNSSSSTSTGNNSKSSSSGSSDSSKTEEVALTHTHTWEPVYTTVHHDAVTQQVKVVDEEAYTEYVAQYEDHSYMVCKICGGHFYSAAEYDAATHTCVGGFYTVSNLVYVGDEVVQHPEVSHYETVTVSEAYDEEVITGYKCSCGATK